MFSPILRMQELVTLDPALGRSKGKCSREFSPTTVVPQMTLTLGSSRRGIPKNHNKDDEP